jgi:hypothetical protein
MPTWHRLRMSDVAGMEISIDNSTVI